MKFLLYSIILCTFLLIASCATAQPKFTEIPTPPERIKLRGYSFVPLNENGWHIIKKDEYQIMLSKLGKNTDETYAILALPFKLPPLKTNSELIHMIESWQEKEKDTQRFKEIKHEVLPYPMKEINCAKSHLVTKDLKAVKRTDNPADMILESIRLTCVHPNEKNFGIGIEYSHRYYSGQNDSTFIEKGTSIFNSIRFNEL